MELIPYLWECEDYEYYFRVAMGFTMYGVLGDEMFEFIIDYR